MIYSATVEVSRFVHIERNNGICFFGGGGGGGDGGVLLTWAVEP